MPDSTDRADDAISTGRAAEMLGVSPAMVVRWIDAGTLKGFRLPGSKFRRVYRDDLEAFAAANGMRVKGGRPAELGR